MKQVKHILDTFLEVLVMISMAVLVIDVLWQVFTRFVLNDPSSWTEELATFLLIWVALLGAAVALGRGAHLGIDFFVGKLPKRLRIQTELLVFGLVTLFSFSVMGYGGLTLVLQTLRLEQTSVALHIPMGYVYLAIPISGAFLVLYGFIGFFERLTHLRKDAPKGVAQ